MLSCDCDNDDAEWWYDDTCGVEPLTTKRMRRCCSCRERIAVGEDCRPFRRWRTVNEYSDLRVLVSLYGDGGELPLPTWYLCDRCAGLYESLDAYGFCGLLGQDLRETCREYAQMQREAGVFRGQMARTPNVRANRPARGPQETR